MADPLANYGGRTLDEWLALTPDTERLGHALRNLSLADAQLLDAALREEHSRMFQRHVEESAPNDLLRRHLRRARGLDDEGGRGYRFGGGGQ